MNNCFFFVFVLGHRLLNIVRHRSKFHVYSSHSFCRLASPMSEPVVETKKVAMEEPLCLKRSCENDVESSTVETQPKKPRLKKKKYVMLMSYCGQGYYGMQINHGFKTIEGDLFQAFEKLGIMDEESVKSPQLINFQRAARTDKGVSATRQVVSLKMCKLLYFIISKWFKF